MGGICFHVDMGLEGDEAFAGMRVWETYGSSSAELGDVMG